jgi:peptidyl-tRNA hydrolase
LGTSSVNGGCSITRGKQIAQTGHARLTVKKQSFDHEDKQCGFELD